MKSKILFIIAAVCLLALSACAYDGRTTQDGPPDLGDTVDFYGIEKTTEPVTLLIWIDNEEHSTRLIQAFTNKYPNVTVAWEQMGNVEAVGNMALDGPAGFGADVFVFPHDLASRAISDGLVEPVPEQLQAKWESELIETAVGTVMHNGRMHGVPWQVENIALFYNRQLWGPTPPETFEEIFEFARTYNNPATNNWTMAWPVHDAYFNFPWLSWGGMQIFGPNHDDFTRPGFDTPEAAKGLEFYQSLRQLFDLPFADINYNTAEERFRLGEIPLTITGPWAFNDLKNNNVDFGVAKIPTYQGIQPIAFSGNQIVGVSSFATPQNRPWAYAFLDFMVSEEGAQIQFETIHTMTTRRDVSNIPGLRDDPHLLGIAQQSPFTIPMPTIPQVNQMWGPLEEMFTFSWDRDMSIPEVQDRAMSSFRTLLEIAGNRVDF